MKLYIVTAVVMLAIFVLAGCIEARVASNPSAEPQPFRMEVVQTTTWKTIYRDRETKCEFFHSKEGSGESMVYIPCTCTKEVCSKN